MRGQEHAGTGTDPQHLVLEYPMVDQDPLPCWSHGRLTLLADAAVVVLSPAPSRVKEVVAVRLPQPRGQAVTPLR
ncbi:hypothetical protein GCM10023322_77330 [Rugosimonospora acidiphila]|uniref:Uncharacterized protein n=1 Tax=Rugosimonospora acidiphila TaxID=556531 RepID=A0ABP9SPB4_9ACTN